MDVLKSCGKEKDLSTTTRVHVDIEEIISKDVCIGTALLSAYAKCGDPSKARELFEQISVRDVVTWNALIGGYAQQGMGLEALQCFRQMKKEQISPDVITYTCILKACSSIGAIDKGEEIHTKLLSNHVFLHTENVVLSTALMDMYAKCGMLAKARKILDELPFRNTVSWNVLIAEYAQQGQCEEALECFRHMQTDNVPPDAITLACMLKVYGHTGAVIEGKQIHDESIKRGFFHKSVVLASALVDMYAKCGALERAQEVFDELPVHDLVSWNALVTGYALLAEVENVIFVFERMKREGRKPDMVTFVSILNACSHSGLIEMGEMYYKLICVDYGIAPTLEHYTCIIDLLSRAGQLDRAVAMMKSSQLHPNMVLWLTILGACCKWGDVELGRHAFEEILRLDEKEDSAYVCMYNIYAYADMPCEAKEVDAMREKNETRRNLCMLD